MARYFSAEIDSASNTTCADLSPILLVRVTRPLEELARSLVEAEQRGARCRIAGAFGFVFHGLRRQKAWFVFHVHTDAVMRHLRRIDGFVAGGKFNFTAAGPERWTRSR